MGTLLPRWNVRERTFWKPKPRQADLEALRAACEKVRELITAAGTSEDELVEDFRRLQRQKREKSA